MARLVRPTPRIAPRIHGNGTSAHVHPGFISLSLHLILGVDSDVCRVQTRPVNTDPHMEFTLEWMLPTPVPMHVFDQPPIVVEVKNR